MLKVLISECQIIHRHKEGKLRIDIRKKFLTMRAASYWNRLPRKVMNAPSLAMSSAGLDKALHNLA